MIRVCIIILFSLLLIPSSSAYTLSERTEYMIEKDWDKILDQYESLCEECIELRVRAEAGEKISGNSVSKLIGMLSNLKKELRDGAGQMSDTQKKRFESIKSHYSEYFGERQEERRDNQNRKNDKTVTGNAKQLLQVQKPEKKAEKPHSVLNEAKESAVTAVVREKIDLPEVHIDCSPAFNNARFVKEVETSLAYQVSKPVEAISESEEKTRLLTWTIAASASFFPAFSYGMTLSIASKATGWGGYLKFQSNFHKTSSTYECLSDGSINGGKVWLSGNSSISKTKVSIGGRKVFGKHFGIYAGTGYGSQALYWEDISGQWALVSDLRISGVLAECGALVDLGALELSLGVSTTAFRYADLEFSIGFNF